MSSQCWLIIIRWYLPTRNFRLSVPLYQFHLMSQSDKVGDKIGIRHNNIHVYTIGDGWFARRNKDFNMTFQNFRGKMMKWTGYADTNYGVDKSVTFEAVWTSFGQKNSDGFQLSRYTETVYWGGKEEYRMVSECEGMNEKD